QTTMTNDVFTEALKQYEEANPGLNWRAGMREQFVRDMKSELQFTNNGFRTVRGSKINVADYITLSLEHGKYLTIKPSTRSEYHPAFPVRSDGTRSAHKRMTETTFRKWCQLEGIVFMPGMESKIAAIIAENFLPVDTPDGPRFHLISDTPIGSLWSKQGFTLEELLNVTGSERFKDNE